MGQLPLAVEYAYRYGHNYQAVFWTRADDREALISGFVTIAELLNLPEKDEQDQTKVVTAVKGWLRTHSKWLLILDNAEDLEIVRDFIPSAPAGHLLLTTRIQALGQLAYKIEVDEMDIEKGALLLLRRARVIAPDASLRQASTTDIAVAKEISEELGGLPLAIDQTGAYIEATQCSLEDYRNLYHDRRIELLKERGSAISNHPEPVTTTWSLSFQKIDQANSAAADLLGLCAFFAPDAIPEEVIREGGLHIDPMLRFIVTDPLELNQAVAALCAYLQLRRNSYDRTLSTHRLVQAVLRDSMDESASHQWVERAGRIVNELFPSAEFGTWPQFERYLPHVQACAELIKRYGMTFPEAAHLLNQAGYYLYRHARFREAGRLLQHALQISEQRWGSDHPSIAISLNNLAVIYQKECKYAEAEALLQRVDYI